MLCLLPTPPALWSQAIASSIQKAAGKKSSQQPSQPADSSSTPAPAATPTPPPPPPVDPLGRTSPQGCVLGFLRAAEAKDYVKASEYLDGKRSPEQAQQLVIELKYLLDLRLSTTLDNLSRAPQGNIDDQLRLTRERVGVVKTNDGDLVVLLDLVTRPGEAPIWLFSQETLKVVPAAYAGVQHKDYSSYFPEWTKSVGFLSMPLWRWALILLSLLLLLVVAWLLTRTFVWLLKIGLRSRFTPKIEAAVRGLRGPVFGLLCTAMFRTAGDYAITALARHYWDMVGLLLAWVCSGWLLIRISDIVVSFLRHRLLLRMQVERVTFVGLMGRLFNILIGIVLVFGLLKMGGVDISALVAGLGIGGIALALAAQRTLADLFGGLSVIMRGAVRVGDFCTIDGVQGTVEDIGISSINLRTMDRSLVSIPNAKVAEGKLENFSMRDQFWLHQFFTLRFDTPHKVVKIVLDRIVQLLATEPDTYRESARARLVGLTPTGPQIEVFAYFRNPDRQWATFLGTQEKIILRIMSIVESEGAGFASPNAVMMAARGNPENPVDSANTDV